MNRPTLLPLFVASSLALGCVLSAGCGSSAPRIVVTPMTPEAEAAFENGADFIDDPSLLEGSWLDAWESDIEHRVTLADAIVLVHITTIRDATDLEHHDSVQLVAAVDQVRIGEGVPSEIELAVREGEGGYGTLRNAESRILNQRFVLFVKWTQNDAGTIVPRWHLSPAGAGVIRRVNTLVEMRRTDASERRRIIVHTTTTEDDSEE
jgi:hypothetical protein